MTANLVITNLSATHIGGPRCPAGEAWQKKRSYTNNVHIG